MKPAFAILVVIGCMMLAASSEVLLDQVPQWIVASVAWIGAGCMAIAFIICIVGIVWQSVERHRRDKSIQQYMSNNTRS